MKCEKHKKGMIVLHAFLEGECIICDTHIDTAHIPCDLVCEKCSEEKSLCHICGESVTRSDKQ